MLKSLKPSRCKDAGLPDVLGTDRLQPNPTWRSMPGKHSTFPGGDQLLQKLWSPSNGVLIISFNFKLKSNFYPYDVSVWYLTFIFTLRQTKSKTYHKLWSWCYCLKSQLSLFICTFSPKESLRHLFKLTSENLNREKPKREMHFSKYILS